MAKYPARHLILSLEAEDLGQVMDIGEVGSARSTIDASIYGEDWADFQVDLQEGEEVPVKLAYDPALSDHIAFMEAYEAGDPVTFGLRHEPSGLDVEFPALILKVTRGGARGDLLGLNASLKILSPGVTDVASS